MALYCRARKIGGSFQHTGKVLVEFETTGGEKRVVFEFDEPISGMLHIYRKDQIEILPSKIHDAEQNKPIYWDALDEMMDALHKIDELGENLRAAIERVLDDGK